MVFATEFESARGLRGRVVCDSVSPWWVFDSSKWTSPNGSHHPGEQGTGPCINGLLRFGVCAPVEGIGMDVCLTEPYSQQLAPSGFDHCRGTGQVAFRLRDIGNVPCNDLN